MDKKTPATAKSTTIRQISPAVILNPTDDVFTHKVGCTLKIVLFKLFFLRDFSSSSVTSTHTNERQGINEQDIYFQKKEERKKEEHLVKNHKRVLMFKV